MTIATEKAVTLKEEVKFIPAWLSWVGSTTTCLNYLGIECDPADVAGYSGYAFTMGVHKGLCPSGPTAFDWGTLNTGINVLGRSTLAFQSGECHCAQTGKTDITKAHCKAVYDLTAREIAENRPVVLWGAYLPEFAVAYGVEDGKFLVKSFKACIGEPEPPIPYEDLEAPGGPYALAFPTPTGLRGKKWGDRNAIGRAVGLLHRKNEGPLYSCGIDAYDTWIAALQAGPDKPPCEKYTPFGNAYNTQCYAEAKKFAQTFLTRLAERNPFAAKEIRKAADEYLKVTEAMDRVAKLFPFPPKDEFSSEETRKEAISALRDAKSAESKAVKALEKAGEIEWPKD